MYRLLTPLIIFLFAAINVGMFSVRENFRQISIETEDSILNINVELAVSNEEQALGLMHTNHLPEGNGMLFIYENPGIPYFWMKNMLISIDMIFIGADNKVNYLVHSAPPCKNGEKCPTYSHQEAVKYVLEVPAGYAKKHNIQPGDKLILN